MNGYGTSRFAQWLQSLKPGEAACGPVVVGLAAFGFGMFKHNEEIKQADARRAADRFARAYDRVVDVVDGAEPEVILAELAWYRRALRHEARVVGVGVAGSIVGLDHDVSGKGDGRVGIDELADEWLRRHRDPTGAFPVKTSFKGAPDAVTADTLRLRLKRMWHHVMLLDAMNPEVQNSNEAMSMRHIRSITGGRELSKDLARQSLIALEPMDRALCRADPRCQWMRDRDPVYAFLRREWDLPEDWPPRDIDDGLQGTKYPDDDKDDAGRRGEDGVYNEYGADGLDQDFEISTPYVPPSRLAQVMYRFQKEVGPIENKDVGVSPPPLGAESVGRAGRGKAT